MKRDTSFFQTVCRLAVPAALQSMLQASFGMIDQLMIGQLGSVSVAGAGLAGKFSSIFSVLISAIGAITGILIAQYLGQNNQREVRRSFFFSLKLSLLFACAFLFPCLLIPGPIMELYTQDLPTAAAASRYLLLTAAAFLPLAGSTCMAALFRCMEKATLPLYASIIAALLNTGLNYVLIFGKCGFAPLGIDGAAIATVIAQTANFLIMLLMMLHGRILPAGCGQTQNLNNPLGKKQYFFMLLPLLTCELLWSLGENIYAGIYGHLGTDACAAMTLLNPIQGLMIGALCGLSQAAGVLIGKMLGASQYGEAYQASKKLLFYGFTGSCLLSLLIFAVRPYYVRLFQVGDTVQGLTCQIMTAYALIAPFKVENMIAGGGILRSGGQTWYVMVIDIVGTWIFGVPLGLLAAFVLRLSVPYVYFLLSLEECVRFGISMIIFRKRWWMKQLSA